MGRGTAGAAHRVPGAQSQPGSGRASVGTGGHQAPRGLHSARGQRHPAATRAGLSLAIFVRSLLPSDLVELPGSTGLPELGELDLVLLTNPHAPAEPVEALTTAILAHTDRIRSLHGTRRWPAEPTRAGAAGTRA
nr:hypothetical protein [Streptomyces antimycoticus]